MTLDVLIPQVIDTAKAGQPANIQAMLSTMESEVESLSRQALQDLAVATAADVKLRHLLVGAFTIDLTTDDQGRQLGGLPMSPIQMLTEYIGEGSVRSASQPGAISPRYHRVQHYHDFIGYLPYTFSYYCVHAGNLWVRAVGGSFQDTTGPMLVECSFVPTLDIVPAELNDDIVKRTALKLLSATQA